jgi:uncharacterized protein
MVRKTAGKHKTEELLFFGEKTPPFTMERDTITIRTEFKNGLLEYYRNCDGREQSHWVAFKDSGIRIHPVEPLHVPKMLTHLLMISFENPIFVEPQHSLDVFLTFPVEIAVLTTHSASDEILDVFSAARTKYTLYGEPHNGVICRHWSSPAATEHPENSLTHQGVLSLTIKNETTRWITVSKSVFNGYGMKLYFNKSVVAMKAVMRIMGKNLAETDFLAGPVEPDMQLSTELFAVKKLSMQSRKYVMEGDL